MQTVKMGEMTVGELQEYLKTNRTIILPYGVVEQHGHHLPLDTDIRNAEILGAKLAEKLGCIVAPTLNYCFSGGMLTGTINVKPNTFSNMVGEIVESLALQGFQNIIILPGHGGSESLQHLKESLRILKWLNPALKDTMIMLVQPWNFSPTWLKFFKTRDYHAGEAETSLIKYWTPEFVRGKIVMDKPAVSEMLRNDPDSYQKRSSLTGMNDEIQFTEQRREVKVGVMGYPEKASAATGGKITGEILVNAATGLKKAIAAADKARKNGTAIEIKNNDKLKILAL
ncbi:MAG: creatininase family protein [Victivallales bacterium]|jgi:creatinine amidohydrolase